jgi:hypothetical protein
MINQLYIRNFVNRAALEFVVEEMEGLDDLPDRLDDLAWRAAEEAKEFWREEAGRMLNTTRLRYQGAIEIYEDFQDGGLVVGMNMGDQLVIDIEEGKPAYDLKPGFMGGRTHRVIPIKPPGDMRSVVAGAGDAKWTHPGFRGLDLAGETDKQLDNVIIPKYLDELFNKL